MRVVLICHFSSFSFKFYCFNILNAFFVRASRSKPYKYNTANQHHLCCLNHHQKFKIWNKGTKRLGDMVERKSKRLNTVASSFPAPSLTLCITIMLFIVVYTCVSEIAHGIIIIIIIIIARLSNIIGPKLISLSFWVKWCSYILY